MNTETQPAQMWHIRVLNEATKKVRDLDEALEAASVAMRKFRADNMRVLGTQLCYVCSDITAREALDRQWHALVVHRDKILQDRNSALANYARLKTELGGN